MFRLLAKSSARITSYNVCYTKLLRAVNVTEELFIDATGSGEVYIYNEPKITLNKFSDTAKLHKKEI